MQREEVREAPCVVWSVIGREMVRASTEIPALATPQTQTLACWGMGKAGVDCQRAAQRHRLGVAFSRKVWKKARGLLRGEGSGLPPQDNRGGCRRGRKTGWRTLPYQRLRDAVYARSAETAKTILDGGKRGKARIAVRAIEGIRNSVFQDPEHGLDCLIGRSTFYRRLRAELPECQVLRSRTDVCDRCRYWDTTVRKAVNQTLARWTAGLNSLAPGAVSGNVQKLRYGAGCNSNN